MNKDPKKSPPPAEDEEPKRRKNRPGRSSRRRKHKARSILLEASGSGGGGQTTTTTAHDDGGVTNQTAESSVVPSDRGYTLEGVKLRRREQWLKRQHASNINTDENDNVTSCCNQEQQHPPINEDEGTSLDPKDDYQLKAQLGFVPGNAICVAARTSLQEVFPSSSSTETSGNNEDSDSSLPLPPPAVVKLYPMAIRETYRGGTTDGRKFKARRRGAERVKKQQRNDDDDDKTAHDDDDNEKNDDETNKQKEKMKTKKERRWFIESPVSEEQAADTTRIDAPQDDDDNNNDDNTNADNDDDDESTKKKKQHIVEPFPTMYWLTSPKLRILISQMELSKDNNVPTMEARLRSSQSYLDQMERSHKSYGKSRWELLTPQDKDSVRQRGWENALDERRGVAGISLKKGRFDCVKCLHAHVAHYLAQVAEWEEEEWKEDEKKRECERDDLNLVGKWTMESIEAALLENAGGGDA